MLKDDDYRRAEDRHAQCRHGTLTQAWTAPADGIGALEDADWSPTVMPICTFPLPDPCPPALKRQWGGSINLEDCIGCPAFERVPALPFNLEGKNDG